MAFSFSHRFFLATSLTLAAAFQSGCSSSAHGPASARGQWEKLPPIPDAQGFAGAFAGVSHGALIVAGGANMVGDKWSSNFKKTWFDSIFVLAQPGGRWQAGFKLAHPLGYGVWITTRDGLTCIGGSDESRHYSDVFTLVWNGARIDSEPLPALPKTCAMPCGAMIDGCIYVAGGLESPQSTNALRTFWSLDLNQSNAQWQELEPWPGPGRMLPVAGVCDGTFYLIGGVELRPDASGHAERHYLNDAYAFTPGAGWRKIAALPHPIAAAPSPALGRDGLWIFSGDDGSSAFIPPSPDHPRLSRTALRYDPRRDAWSESGDLPFTIATAPATEWRGHLVIPMGEIRPRQRTTDVWWMPLPPDHAAEISTHE